MKKGSLDHCEQQLVSFAMTLDATRSAFLSTCSVWDLANTHLQVSFVQEVDEGLTRMKHEAIEIAVQALRLSLAPHVGKMECIECVEEFEFLYDESV